MGIFPDNDGGGGAEERVPAVARPGFPERSTGFVPVLSIPAGVDAGEYVKHELALEHHHDRCRQRAENNFRQHALDRPEKAADVLEFVLRQIDDQPQKFGENEHEHGKDEQTDGTEFVKNRPGREQRVISREIFRLKNVASERCCQADQKEGKPQRGRQIGHDADDEMHAADRVQAFGNEHFHMLHVALTPAAVAHGEVDHRRRTFFEASF